jgi:hypothetical protein
VVATTVECNVRVGNRYVDLIRAEKEKFDAKILEDKYGFLHDQAISESSSKTLQLVQLLQGKVEIEESPATETPVVAESPQKDVRKERNEKKNEAKVKTNVISKSFRVNKWLLAATILIVVVNIALYIWMSSGTATETSPQKVERVNLESSSLREFIKDARIANKTFFGVVQANWTSLDKEKQEEVLNQIYSTASTKGFTKAHLLNSTGRTVGYIDASGTQLY